MSSGLGSVRFGCQRDGDVAFMDGEFAEVLTHPFVGYFGNGPVGAPRAGSLAFGSRFWVTDFFKRFWGRVGAVRRRKSSVVAGGSMGSFGRGCFLRLGVPFIRFFLPQHFLQWHFLSVAFSQWHFPSGSIFFGGRLLRFGRFVRRGGFFFRLSVPASVSPEVVPSSSGLLSGVSVSAAALFLTSAACQWPGSHSARLRHRRGLASAGVSVFRRRFWSGGAQLGVSGVAVSSYLEGQPIAPSIVAVAS